MSYAIPDYESLVPSGIDYTWNSTSDFEFSSFSGVHTGANSTLHSIFPKFSDFAGFSFDSEDILKFTEENVNVNEMVWDNRGPLVFGIVGILLGFLITIIGVFWCFAKCCACLFCKKKKFMESDEHYVENRFGHRDESQMRTNNNKRRKRNSKIKIGFGVLLFVSIAVYFTFLIALFVTNAQLNESLGEISDDIDVYKDDGVQLIELTTDQINSVMIECYEELDKKLQEIIDEYTPTVPPPDGSFDKNDGGSSGQIDERNNFSALELILNDINLTLSQISKGSSDSSSVDSLQIQINSFISSIHSFKNELQDKSEVLEIKEELKNAINSTKYSLMDSAMEIENSLNSVKNEIIESRDKIRDSEEEFDKAKDGVYYSLNGVHAYFLLSIFLVSLGSCLSFTNTFGGLGNLLINIGLILIFIVAFIVWVFAIGTFLLAGSLSVILPGAYENITLSNSTNFINSEESYKIPSVQHIIQGCDKNETAYNVFKLEQVFNFTELDEYQERIKEILEPRLKVPLLEPLREKLTNIEIAYLELIEKIPSQELEELFEKFEAESRKLFESDTDQFAENISNQFGNYTTFVKDQIESNIGRTWPLNNVLLSTLYTFSYKIGSPIGAYWFSLNLMLFLLYPIIISTVVIQYS